jgi:hypothetical protein
MSNCWLWWVGLLWCDWSWLYLLIVGRQQSFTVRGRSMERDGDMRGALRRGAGGGARGGGAGRGHGRGSHATGRSGPSRMRIEIARTGRTACCTAHRGTGAVRAPQRRDGNGERRGVSADGESSSGEAWALASPSAYIRTVGDRGHVASTARNSANKLENKRDPALASLRQRHSRRTRQPSVRPETRALSPRA